MPFPPYSGPDTTCPVCGNVGAYTTYKDGMVCQGATHDYETTNHQGGASNPRLCRRCERCDYAWDEATILHLPPDATIAVPERETVGRHAR